LIDISLILLSAGESSRFNSQIKKQWLRIDNKPLWLFVTDKFNNFYNFKEIIITSHKEEINYMENFTDYKIIEGGDTRQKSLQNSLKYITSEYVLVTDIARCCIPKDMILNIINNSKNGDCIVPYIKTPDTVIFDNNRIDRDKIKLIQTPQLSKTDILKKALNTKTIFTDDSSAIKSIGGKVFYVNGSEEAKKLTFKKEIKSLDCLVAPSKDNFIGNGFDVHKFTNKKDFIILGGIKIRCGYGFKAHSDGDVLIHSLIDSMLGAIGAGDIGEIFPDTDKKYKGIDSTILLNKIFQFITKVGFEIINIDITIIAQQPKISPYKKDIKKNLAKLLNLTRDRVNIKATTTEKLGFTGRKEGIAVLSSINLKYFDWTNK